MKPKNHYKSMMAVPCFFLTALIVTTAHSAPLLEQCNVDSECFYGFFCSLEKYCDPCIPCERIYNRHPMDSTLATCAKVDDDCGSCLPGYQADDLTDQRRAMKCHLIQQAAISLEETSSKTENPSILTIFAASSLISFLLVIALFAFFSKCIRRRFSQLPPLETGIELENISPPTLPCQQDQHESQDGTNDTDQLMSSFQTPQKVNVIQNEREIHCGAIPIGRYDRYGDTPSEASHPTAPRLADINSIGDPSTPANESQPPELRLELVTPTEVPLPLADLPIDVSGSRCPDGEQSRRRRGIEEEESLNICLAVGITAKRFKRSTAEE